MDLTGASMLIIHAKLCKLSKYIPFNIKSTLNDVQARNIIGRGWVDMDKLPSSSFSFTQQRYFLNLHTELLRTYSHPLQRFKKIYQPASPFTRHV